MDTLGIQIKAQAMLEGKTSHTLRDLMESLQNDSGINYIYIKILKIFNMNNHFFLLVIF